MRRTETIPPSCNDCLEILRAFTYCSLKLLPRTVIGIPPAFCTKFSGSNHSAHEDCPHAVLTECDKETASYDRGEKLLILKMNAHIFNRLLPIIFSVYFYLLYLAKTRGSIDISIR